MPRRLLPTGGAIGLLGLGAVFALPAPSGPARDFDGLDGDAARGAYLARLGGCFACHTRRDGPVLAGGSPIKTPFGDFTGPNITMHEEDGIGAWSLADFSRAVSDGVSPSGAHYFPVFPYAHYAAYSDQDIADLWAAFRTVPPAAGKTAHDVAFPFNLRVLQGPWKALFAHFEPPASDPARSDQWNRGRWLTEGPGHCGACHTPKNPFGGAKVSRRFSGAVLPDGEKAPAITPDALKRRGYDAEQLAIALKTGLAPDGDALGGSMGAVVSGATRYWSRDDLEAIAAYLVLRDD